MWWHIIEDVEALVWFEMGWLIFGWRYCMVAQ